MELHEEKQLKECIDEFTAAVRIFMEKNYSSAATAFEAIMEKYKDSDYYSVLEVQGRARAYKNMCQAQLNPVKIELNSDQDYLNQGIYYFNAGNYNHALELLSHIENKGFQDTYVNYLLALTHLKKGSTDVSFEYLRKTVALDPSYKVIIFNAPEFAAYQEHDTFNQIVAI